MHEGAQASWREPGAPGRARGSRNSPRGWTAPTARGAHGGCPVPVSIFFSFRPPLDLLYYNPLLWEFPLRAWVRIRASKGHRRPFWNVRCMSPCASHLGPPARSPSSLAFPCVMRAFFMRKIGTDIVFANGKMAPSSGAIPVRTWPRRRLPPTFRAAGQVRVRASRPAWRSRTGTPRCTCTCTCDHAPSRTANAGGDKRLWGRRPDPLLLSLCCHFSGCALKKKRGRRTSPAAAEILKGNAKDLFRF